MRYIITIFLCGTFILSGVGCSQNTDTPDFLTKNTHSSTPQTEPSANDQPATKEKTKKINVAKPLTYDKYGYHGIVTAKGYLKVVYSTGACEDANNPDCGDYNYAMFKIEETDNLDLLNFVGTGVKTGDPYLGAKMIGLGCYKRGEKIYSTSASDEGVSQNIISGKELALLEKSNANKLVALTMTKPILTGKNSAPECYSHFRDFKVGELK